MASAEIAHVCGLNALVGCQDTPCRNSDADDTLAKWDGRYVRVEDLNWLEKLN